MKGSIDTALLEMAEYLCSKYNVDTPEGLQAIKAVQWQCILPIYVQKFSGVAEQLQEMGWETMKRKSIALYRKHNYAHDAQCLEATSQVLALKGVKHLKVMAAKNPSLRSVWLKLVNVFGHNPSNLIIEDEVRGGNKIRLQRDKDFNRIDYGIWENGIQVVDGLIVSVMPKSAQAEAIDKIKKAFEKHQGIRNKNVASAAVYDKLSSKLADIVDSVARDEFAPLRVPSTSAGFTQKDFDIRIDVEGKYSFALFISGTFKKPITIVVTGTGPYGEIDGKYTDHVNFLDGKTLLAQAKSFIKEVIARVKHLYLAPATVHADANTKFQVPPTTSKSWKHDSTIDGWSSWEWYPVRNHRVTISGTKGKLKVTTFNIPEKGSFVLDIDGRFSGNGTEQTFPTFKEAHKGFLIAYKNYKPKTEEAKAAKAAKAVFNKQPVQTPDGWDAALEKFVDGVQKLEDKYIADNDYKHLHGTRVIFEDAVKFTKVFLDEPHGNKRIYCFIDRNNGDVLKPATYTVPAKGARGNIFADDHGLKRMGPHGPAYNK